MQDNEKAQPGITRREALRKGTLAGLGMVWVTPAVTSVEMSPALAQATSGPETDTTQGQGNTSTSNGGTTPTSNDGTTATTSDVGNTSSSAGAQASSTAGGATSSSQDVRSQTTAQGTTGGPTAAPETQVLADDLPFTGLPLEQLLPLAGGAVATGAAIVRAARDKEDPDSGPSS